MKVWIGLPLLVVSASIGGRLQADKTKLPDVSKPGINGLLSSEFIYAVAEAKTPQCHASTIVETKNGLVAAWFGGAHERNPDVGIWLSRHVHDQWTTPVQVVNGSEKEQQDYACWNPVLFQPDGGPLMLYYKVGLNPRDWWGALVTSKDHGVSWSDPQRLGTDPTLPKQNQNLLGPVKNKPIQLADGSILCPTSTENDGWKVHFELTKDFSKTTKVIGPLEGDFNAIQPSILTYPDGRLQILCRTQEGVIAQGWSKDNGRTWSPLSATDLPNPNSGTDAITLEDGRQLLVYNHTQRNGEFPANRNMLNIAISTDGHEWNPVLTLERAKGEYSYPAVIQANDGKVHITYTWKRITVKHAVLDPALLN